MSSNSNRTIEPGVSVFSSAEIRVAILPVGPVPKGVLDEYTEQIKRFRQVSLSAARSFYREPNQKTPFQHIDWKHGVLQFRFLQADEARRKTRIVDLHPSRQLSALIGVVHCPMAPDIQEAYEEFQTISRQYPEAYVHRCFMFEPSEDHIRQESQHLKNLVMFPPGQSHLEQHLEVWMHDLAALVLTELERWMLTSGPSVIKPGGYADSGEFTGQSAVIEEVTKRLVAMSDEEAKENRRWGRLMKAKGDLCLMSGSPEDAWEMYRSCIELAKASNDYVWHAAALEGCAQARMLAALRAAEQQALGSNKRSSATGTGDSPGGANTPLQRIVSLEKDSTSRRPYGDSQLSGACVWNILRQEGVEAEMRELFSEARSWYRKKGGVLPMQIELSLKLARLLAGLHGVASRHEVLELVGSVLESVSSLHLLEDRLVAMGEAAQVVGLVGCGRKRQLLLWHAAELARLCNKGELLRLSIAALEPPDDPRKLGAMSGGREEGSGEKGAEAPSSMGHWTLRRAAYLAINPSAWASIQAASLEAALSAAKHAGAPAEAWEATAALLREHYTRLAPQTQASLLDAMAQAAASLSERARLRPGRGPSPLAMLKQVLPPPPSLLPHRMSSVGRPGAVSEEESAASKGPFIFNPYAGKRQVAHSKQQSNGNGATLPEWVCGEDCRVELYLVSPLSVALKIDAVTLHVEYSSPSPLPTDAANGTSCALDGDHHHHAAASATLAQRGPSALNALPQQPTTQKQQQQRAQARWQQSLSEEQYWQPHPVALTLIPNGKPMRLQLCGTPLLAGKYTLLGVRFTAAGVSWQEPFGEHRNLASAVLAHKRLVRTGDDPNPALTPSPARPLTISVLPGLPLLRASLACGEWRPASIPTGKNKSSTGSSNSQRTLFRAVAPSDAELNCGRATAQGGGAAAASSSSGAAVSSAPQTVGSPTAGRTVAASAPLDVVTATLGESRQGQAAAVAVWEGQRATWTLTLSNIGKVPVGAVHLSIVNSKGASLPSLAPVARLAPSFVGASLQLRDDGAEGGALALGLPLEPGSSLDVAVELHVGQTPADSFDDRLELCVAYTAAVGAPSAAAHQEHDVAASTAAGSEEEKADGMVMGRKMAIQVHFLVQRALQVTGLHFLEYTVPAKDGERFISPRMSLKGGGLEEAPSSSDGCDLKGHASNSGLKGNNSGVKGNKVISRKLSTQSMLQDECSFSLDEAGSRHQLSLVTDCVMEVVVNNMSDRYFRVWLQRQEAVAPPHEGGGSSSWSQQPSLSSSKHVSAAASTGEELVLDEVIPPAEGTSLRCLLPPCTVQASSCVGGGGEKGGDVTAPGMGYHPSLSLPATGGAGPSSHHSGLVGQPGVGGPSSNQQQQQQQRQQPSEAALLSGAAHALTHSWALCWRMITAGEGGSGGSAEVAPCGRMQLSAVDVAKALTQHAVAVLQPSQLRFSFAAVLSGHSGKTKVQDLTRRMQEQSLRQAGEVWGLRVEAGDIVELEVTAISYGVVPQLIQFSLATTPLASLEDSAQLAPTLFPSNAVAAAAVDCGVVLIGAVEAVRCNLQPNVEHVHRVAAMFLDPGLYQMCVHDVHAAMAIRTGSQNGVVAGTGGGATDGVGLESRLQRVYFSSERLNILVH